MKRDPATKKLIASLEKSFAGYYLCSRGQYVTKAVKTRLNSRIKKSFGRSDQRSRGEDTILSCMVSWMTCINNSPNMKLSSLELKGMLTMLRLKTSPMLSSLSLQEFIEIEKEIGTPAYPKG